MNRLVFGPSIILCLALVLNIPALAAPAPGEAQLAIDAVQALVDQQLGSTKGTLNVLATTSEVQGLDWDAMQPLLASFQDHCPPCAVWFTLTDGTYYTVQNGKSDQSLADREYFGRLTGGEEILGDIVVSKSTGQLSAVVAVPVFHDTEVVGALGVSLFAENLAGYLAQALQLPEGMSLMVRDINGETAFAIPAATPQWLAELEAEPAEGNTNQIELELGTEHYEAIYQVSPFNGWSYLVGIELE